MIAIYYHYIAMQVFYGAQEAQVNINKNEIPRLQRTCDPLRVASYLSDPLSGQGDFSSLLYEVDQYNRLPSSPPYSTEITALSPQRQLSLRTQYLSSLLSEVNWPYYMLTKMGISADRLPRHCQEDNGILPLGIAEAIVDWSVAIRPRDALKRDGKEWERLYGKLSSIDVTNRMYPGNKIMISLDPEEAFELLDFVSDYLSLVSREIQRSNEKGGPDGWANVLNITSMNINNILDALSANYHEPLPREGYYDE